MTGPLRLAADPTAAMEAATKQYVDASINGVPTSLGTTTNAANKLVVTTPAGKIDPSLLPVGAQYKGSVDITGTYTAPVPALNNGDYYNVAADGTTSPTWRAVIDGNPATLRAGQMLIWDGTWFHVSGGGAAIGDIDVGTF
jgi:hypothetical protein